LPKSFRRRGTGVGQILKQGFVIKKFLTPLIIILFFQGLAEAGQKVLVVQSLRVAPYEEAFAGFQETCKADIEKIILSESPNHDLFKVINSTQPDLVLAIGVDALKKLQSIKKNLPILYLMVFNPHSVSYGGGNIGGVCINILPEQQVETIREVLPKVKRIGLLYDPKKSGEYIQQAREVTSKRGVSLVIKEVHRPQEVSFAMKELEGKVDLVWMIPDTTVVTPETVEGFLLFSLENKVPVLTFSKKYVEMGCLMAIEADGKDVGEQGGEIAEEVLSKRKDMRDVGVVKPRKVVVTVNMKIAKKLGISIEGKVLRKVNGKD
jgi:putative tryptophan/tyrosine transport system substrate-binding protein